MGNAEYASVVKTLSGALLKKRWQQIAFHGFSTSNGELLQVVVTRYFEMTGNQIDALGIKLLNAETCDLEPPTSLI
jgi:hypothetical protein